MVSLAILSFLAPQTTLLASVLVFLFAKMYGQPDSNAIAFGFLALVVLGKLDAAIHGHLQVARMLEKLHKETKKRRSTR